MVPFLRRSVTAGVVRFLLVYSNYFETVMRKIILSALFCLMLAPLISEAQKNKVRVALFAGHGGAETCVMETEAALKMDPALEVRKVWSKEIASGSLDDTDVLVFPGGGGSTEYLNLGGLNAERVKAFVRNGGGVVGICAGAYLLSDTPDYACLALSSGTATDIEHDHRGRGIAKATLTESGKALFPEIAYLDTLFVMYYEGPVIVPSETPGMKPYTTLAVMESDVAVEEDVPGGVTAGKPFLYANDYGKGKVMAVIGHPEATPGMQWMVARMVHAVSPNMVPSRLPDKFVKPNLFGKEILMDKARRDFEDGAYETLLYGKEDEVVAALDSLMALNSWSAKRWIQGLLYHPSAKVRARTAELMGERLFKMYERDLRAALKSEKDAGVRQALFKAIMSLSTRQKPAGRRR